MEYDPTRMCELLVGLPDVRIAPVKPTRRQTHGHPILILKEPTGPTPPHTTTEVDDSLIAVVCCEESHRVPVRSPSGIALLVGPS